MTLKKRWLASDVIAMVAPKLGILVEREPEYGMVGRLILPDGRNSFFRGATLDLNGYGSAEVARDKAFALYFLSARGYPVPKTHTFFSPRWCQLIGSTKGPEAGWLLALDLGLPVVLKPNSRSQGVGVAVVEGKPSFVAAASAAFEDAQDRVALVQELVGGRDYRVVVLDDEVISAYERVPYSVVGDGDKSVAALIADRRQSLAAVGRKAPGLDDFRVASWLRHARLTPSYVPQKGETIRLMLAANLSTGGESEDVTARISVGYADLSVSIARDMGLRLCGVDLLVRHDVTKQPTPDAFTVLEVNAAPGLDHYAFSGRRQRQVVERLYTRALEALLRTK